jgi:hypothetical protein
MNATKTSQSKPTPREIAALAHEIWEKGGCKPGTDMENWLQAEKQLKAAKQSAPPTKAPEPAETITADPSNDKANRTRGATNVRQQNHLVQR